MGALVAARLGLVGVTAQIFSSRLVAAILAQFCDALLGQQVPALQMHRHGLGPQAVLQRPARPARPATACVRSVFGDLHVSRQVDPDVIQIGGLLQRRARAVSPARLLQWPRLPWVLRALPLLELLNPCAAPSPPRAAANSCGLPVGPNRRDPNHCHRAYFAEREHHSD